MVYSKFRSEITDVGLRISIEELEWKQVLKFAIEKTGRAAQLARTTLWRDTNQFERQGQVRPSETKNSTGENY